MEEFEYLAKLAQARSRHAIENEQRLFVLEGIDDPEDLDTPGTRKRKDKTDIRHKFFLGIVLRAHVPVEHVWYVYRDGTLYRQLTAGPHFLWNWNIFLTTWQVRRLNLRRVLLPAVAIGRVKGPSLPLTNNEAANAHLALQVATKFRLVCRLGNIDKFLEHELPINTFYASFNHIVQKHISELPYDQYGKWAEELAKNVEKDLQNGPNNTLDLVEIQIESVFVDAIDADDEHDAQVLEMYKLVETSKRDLYTSLSWQAQGQILNIPQSLLALQNNEIGRDLIRHDAKLRELMVMAGLQPGGMLPIAGTQVSLDPNSSNRVGYLGSSISQPQLPPGVSSYLSTNQGNGMPPFDAPTGPSTSSPYVGNPGSLPGFNPSPQGGSSDSLPGFNTSFPYAGNTGSFPGSNPVSPEGGSSGSLAGVNSAAFTPPQSLGTGSFQLPNQYQPQPLSTNPPPPPSSMAASVMKQRQESELEKLRAVGFSDAFWTQETAQYDAQGQPIAGSIVWSLKVFVPLNADYLTLLFRCSQEYPMKAPEVKARPPQSQEWKELRPQTVADWHSNRWLVEVVHEINKDLGN
jgi:hypothetical protein